MAISRRTFLATTAVAGTELAATKVFAKTDKNSKIRCAVLGVNGRGTGHVHALENNPDAEVVVLCDPDEKVAGGRLGHTPFKRCNFLLQLGECSL